ncbi:MAG: T9SS type A sorting domain-containing protein [Lentimicrobium sp.]|nr:T9SS type A sorting domain-containing protein [Lentimicrobium sp.]
MKNIFLIIFTFFLILFLPVFSFGQLSHGGIPQGFLLKNKSVSITKVSPGRPDIEKLLHEDAVNEAAGMPERMGIGFIAGYNTSNAGSWITYGGRQIWNLQIELPGAVGIGLYFTDFNLPAGAELFIYSADKQHFIGAFSNHNNHPSGLFATEIVKGDKIIVEYSVPEFTVPDNKFTISEVLFVYRPMSFPVNKSALNETSGSCQVNTICNEGDNWRDQIKSVVKIVVKTGLSSFWCTGSLINNTAYDFEPYLLTADHCARSGSGAYASPQDVLQWVFYFRNESQECDNTVLSESKTLTGAVKVASSSPLQNDGSDFYLLLLNNNIPASFEAYFSGWDRTGDFSPSGVGIHHPSGDVKKISTYTTQLTNDQWGNNPETHFRLNWSATANGHGTTEGGSSGSPLFDNKGRIIGLLTGGQSGCTNLTGFDYYGKFSYSWLSNGSNDTLKLQPWLDPLNIGSVNLNGTYNDKQVYARFHADTNIVAVENSLRFNDLSQGNPVSWKWRFEGGKPEFSTLRDPGFVKYSKLGRFNVSLTVTNEFGADSLLRENYITVVPKIFPNPAYEYFNVMTGSDPSKECSILVADATGRIVYEAQINQGQGGFKQINTQFWKTGLYVVRVNGPDFSYSGKLIRSVYKNSDR